MIPIGVRLQDTSKFKARPLDGQELFDGTLASRCMSLGGHVVKNLEPSPSLLGRARQDSHQKGNSRPRKSLGRIE